MLKKTLFTSLVIALAISCSVSYKFNGASIDYTKIKTISIKNFSNLAPLVNPTLASSFNEALRDIFAKQTRLQFVKTNGDLHIEGEITGYDLAPMSVQSDAIAGETRLTVTIKVRFTNKSNPSKDFEKSYSAFQNFSNDKTLNDVETEICEAIIEELTETIYNETVADW